jgi:DNA (cytosine-5)-methyltransferase 1
MRNVGRTANTAASNRFAVKQVRGPFIRPSPHPDHCEDEKQLLALIRRLERPTAIDLFCGAGGLGLGLQDAGFDVVMGVDSDKDSVETHRALFPGLSVEWDLADPDVVDRIASIVKRGKISLIAGGPPCQPFSSAGRGLIRHLVETGRRDSHDHRRELWRSFLGVIEKSTPPAVLMENVPDMALDPDMAILRAMVHRLESLGYHVATRVLETWRFGVPQFRERLFLVALRENVSFEWPAESTERVTVANAIGDLPLVEGGARPGGGAEGFWNYDGPQSSFQKRARRGLAAAQRSRIYDHITRPVREDDRAVFMQMDSKTRYTDIAPELRRYRDDIFTDKYKRLDNNDLSRTITAHIARDGYWYIHPSQPRTLTVREAARIQTFRDNIRFAGPPSSAFRQIGNAVPPLMAERLGESILTALRQRTTRRISASTKDLADALARWFVRGSSSRLPWFKAKNRWLSILAEMLFDRVRAEHAVRAWPIISRMKSPRETIKRRKELDEMASCLGRSGSVASILETANWFVDNPRALRGKENMSGAPHLDDTTVAIATHVMPYGGGHPVVVTNGVLRIVARFRGNDLDSRNRRTDGRIATARLVGGGKSSRTAFLALIGLSRSICRPKEPLCHECPLQKWCVTGTANIKRQPALF